MLKVSTVTSSTLSIESIQDNHAKSIHMLQVVHCQLKNTRDNPAKSIHMLQLVHCQKHVTILLKVSTCYNLYTVKNTRDNPAKSIHMLQLVHCQKHK